METFFTVATVTCGIKWVKDYSLPSSDGYYMSIQSNDSIAKGQKNYKKCKAILLVNSHRQTVEDFSFWKQFQTKKQKQPKETPTVFSPSSFLVDASLHGQYCTTHISKQKSAAVML